MANFYIKDLNKEQFEVEVVTPLFLGGADKNSAELRTASIKGMMRFWWRAVYGGEFNSIAEMKKKEVEIFGSTENKASFLIQITGEVKSVKQNLPGGRQFETKSSRSPNPFKLSIIDYLAFGSLRDHKSGYTREHIKENSKFYLDFVFYNKQYRDEIINSFFYFIKYGGLGSKCRNGFGSLNLLNKKIDLNISSNSNARNFFAFSTESKLYDNFPLRNSWVDALSDVGMVYKDARLNKNIDNKHNYNRRALIGKPIVQAPDREIKSGRLSKPLFLHVNKINNQYKGQILIVPYKINDVSFWKTLKDNIENEIKKLTKGVC